MTVSAVYGFAKGTLVWIAFAVFFLGTVYRLVRMIVLARRDKAVYQHFSLKFGIRSLAHWVVPFASRSMRVNAGMTALTFLFHLGLLVTPVFLLAHNVILERAWGFRLPCLPEGAADGVTLVVIFIGLFFIGRRLFLPAAAYVTVASDWMVLGIVLAPFVTGYMAAHAWLDYGTMVVLHAFSGVLWIMAIPFTRLNHMISFFFTRAYMGCEFGAVRNARDW